MDAAPGARYVHAMSYWYAHATDSGRMGANIAGFFFFMPLTSKQASIDADTVVTRQTKQAGAAHALPHSAVPVNAPNQQQRDGRHREGAVKVEHVSLTCDVHCHLTRPDPVSYTHLTLPTIYSV